MDRNMVYPGAIPLDTDVLTVQVSVMKAIGFLAQAALGTSTVVDGLACTQTASPSLAVIVAPGSILAGSTVDATSFGSLPADTTDALMKMGINLTATTLSSFIVPGTSGQSVNYLIEAALQESDQTSVVLPYYNSANPAVPFSGPANSGTPQNTQRLQTVNLVAKAGTPATTGTQTTPAADSGFTGLFVVTIAHGATTIVNANISQFPGAPFLATFPLGAHGEVDFATSNTWTVPNGVFSARFQVWGSTSGSGGSASATAGGGAGGGAYSKKAVAVTPGSVYTFTSGVGGALGGTAANGSAGGTTTLTGTGVAITLGTSNVGIGSAGGGTGGAGAPAGSGGDINLAGGSGTGAIVNGSLTLGGIGGASPFGGGITGTTVGTPQIGNLPGGAPGGGANSQNGAAGSAGYMRVTW